LYEIAYNLKIPVYQLLTEMPYDELLKWTSFFRKRPVGWQEDQRTYLLLRAAGVKGSAENIFHSLKVIKQEQENKQVPDQAVPKGKFLEMMLKAKNGDNSGWTIK
jgi:hypothetical protein